MGQVILIKIHTWFLLKHYRYLKNNRRIPSTLVKNQNGIYILNALKVCESSLRYIKLANRNRQTKEEIYTDFDTEVFRISCHHQGLMLIVSCPFYKISEKNLFLLLVISGAHPKDQGWHKPITSLISTWFKWFQLDFTEANFTSLIDVTKRHICIRIRITQMKPCNSICLSAHCFLIVRMLYIQL